MKSRGARSRTPPPSDNPEKIVIVTGLSQLETCQLSGPVGKNIMVGNSWVRSEALRKLGKEKILGRFAAGLQRWREARKRKISDVATEFGVAASTWGHWETGHRFPSGENLALITEYTGIPLQHFICPNSDRCPFAKRLE